MEGHLEKLRRAELDCIKSYFKPGMRVLELGGGSGYQASIVASWGYEVLSIDLPKRSTTHTPYYPVQDYDGENIPFENETFDIVFTSNVLEHIPSLPPILGEIRRVLKSGGLVIHILPSPAWRFWTSIAHYFYILKRLISPKKPISGLQKLPSVNEKLEQQGLSYVIKRILIAGAHGEYPNALSELYYFRKARWLQIFKENKFYVIKASGNNLFYTGYALFPNLPLATRQTMSKWMGQSCHIFVMKDALKLQPQDK